MAISTAPRFKRESWRHGIDLKHDAAKEECPPSTTDTQLQLILNRTKLTCAGNTAAALIASSWSACAASPPVEDGPFADC